jgi:hypothetical protein
MSTEADWRHAGFRVWGTVSLRGRRRSSRDGSTDSGLETPQPVDIRARRTVFGVDGKRRSELSRAMAAPADGPAAPQMASQYISSARVLTLYQSRAFRATTTALVPSPDTSTWLL